MEFQFDEASGVYSFDLDLLFTRRQWAKLMERSVRQGYLNRPNR